MMRLLEKIYPLRLAPVSPDTDKAAGILCKELPFKVHEYISGAEHNGWTVPHSWRPIKANIMKGDKIIYDGMASPLGVVGYSSSFQGKVTHQELKEHLFYHPGLPKARVYHCDYYYKPWRRSWGLSVPETFYRSLKKGLYDVNIETESKPSTMKVLAHQLEGRRPETIILNAHNCHAGQANDDIAGVVAGVEVMKRLQAMKSRRYTYRLVVAPEHLGTVFYLASMKQQEVAAIKFAMFLEMLGTDGPFALQKSFTGETLLDRAAAHYMHRHYPKSRIAAFRKVVGNDETVWEAPGYEIPCISISRQLYPEYHSDKDTAAIISEKKLEESVGLVMGIIDILETNATMQRNFTGLLALSNPAYDLYMPTIDPSLREDITRDQLEWNYLMDCIVRYFDNTFSILDVAMKHGLDYKKLYDYVKKFEAKGLISFNEK